MQKEVFPSEMIVLLSFKQVCLAASGALELCVCPTEAVHPLQPAQHVRTD